MQGVEGAIECGPPILSYGLDPKWLRLGPAYLLEGLGARRSGNRAPDLKCFWIDRHELAMSCLSGTVPSWIRLCVLRFVELLGCPQETATSPGDPYGTEEAYSCCAR